jgi:hypothetical protein
MNTIQNKILLLDHKIFVQVWFTFVLTPVDGTKNYLSNRNEGTLRYKVRNKQTIPLKTE